jgi:hypothetical protein
MAHLDGPERLVFGYLQVPRGNDGLAEEALGVSGAEFLDEPVVGNIYIYGFGPPPIYNSL